MKRASLPFVALALVAGACTPAQRAPARTALEVSRCAHEVAIRHLDAGDDFADPETLAALGIEIATECNPLEKAQQ